MTYAAAGWMFTRALGLIYFIAFTSLALEARGLWGARGVLPISEFLEGMRPAPGETSIRSVPSVFWFASGDGWLVGAAILGAVAGLLAAMGVATGWMFAVCFILYLSFVTTGQEFLSFQWDILLIEVGFIALFLSSWTTSFSLFTATNPPWLVRAAMIGVLFKLMFLSGVVKILSGDPAWRDFTALSYHYWTQPLPNPLSLFAHAAPGWLHKFATVGTFAVELGLPFGVFFPPARPFVAIGFTALSLLIGLTGNYTFFNLLTVALSFWLIPDAWWFDLLDRAGVIIAPAAVPPLLTWTVGAVMAVVLAADLYWCARYWLPSSLSRAVAPVMNVLRGYNVSNSYGLFATMTKTRPEIVIEGSADGETWVEYVFKYKPGPPSRRPPIVAPLQPRLDWQMWFAALGSFRQNPFVGALMARVFEGAPEVQRFFVTNPFPDQPPRFLRAKLYEYEFTTPGALWATGDWWTRRPVGDYSPTFQGARPGAR